MPLELVLRTWNFKGPFPPSVCVYLSRLRTRAEKAGGYWDISHLVEVQLYTGPPAGRKSVLGRQPQRWSPARARLFPPSGGPRAQARVEGPPSTHPAVPPAAAPSASFHVRRVPGTAEAPGYCSDPNRPRSCSLGISVSLGRESQETVSKGERIIRRKISKGGGQKGVACPLQWSEQHLPALTRDPRLEGAGTWTTRPRGDELSTQED